jgi:hypothetical protein
VVVPTSSFGASAACDGDTRTAHMLLRLARIAAQLDALDTLRKSRRSTSQREYPSMNARSVSVMMTDGEPTSALTSASRPSDASMTSTEPFSWNFDRLGQTLILELNLQSGWRLAQKHWRFADHDNIDVRGKRITARSSLYQTNENFAHPLNARDLRSGTDVVRCPSGRVGGSVE